MFKKNINFKNFEIKKNKKDKDINEILRNIIKQKSEVILSFTNGYKNSYSNNILKKLNNFKKVILIGMGGSSLGVKAIYSFLKPKKKKVSIYR